MVASATDSATEARIRQILDLAVPRHARRIQNIPDYDADDLYQDAWMRVTQSISTYDPTRTKLNTFITMIVIRCAIDRARKHLRRAPKHVEMDEEFDQADQDQDDSSIVAWVVGNHALLAERFAERPSKLRKTRFTTAHKIVLGLLVGKLRHSTRDTEAWLAGHPDVCRDIGLPRPPSHMTLHRFVARARLAVTELRGK